MTRIRLTLMLFFTLPSSFFIAQGAAQTSPFDRYLDGIRVGAPEVALVRVAAECGINLKSASVRYADRPEEEWKMVGSLIKARDDQETDFLSTAAFGIQVRKRSSRNGTWTPRQVIRYAPSIAFSVQT